MALATARRILILGPSGAGKSTLALALGARLGLPVIHLDAEFWKPGWVEPDRDEFVTRVARLAGGREWVMEGNYSHTLDGRLARADQIVYIHASRWRCLLNVLRRWARHRGGRRPDMAEGCPEKVDLEFLRWVLWVQPQGRRRALQRLESSGLPLTQVRCGAAALRLVTELGGRGG